MTPKSEGSEEFNNCDALSIENDQRGERIDYGNAKDCADDGTSTEYELEEEIGNDRTPNESMHVPVRYSCISTKGCPTQKEICQNIYRAEKFSKKVCLNFFHALPSPSCPQMKCSTWCLLNLPNWLLYFFVNENPSDITLTEFQRQQENKVDVMKEIEKSFHEAKLRYHSGVQKYSKCKRDIAKKFKRKPRQKKRRRKHTVPEEFQAPSVEGQIAEEENEMHEEGFHSTSVINNSHLDQKAQTTIQHSYRLKDRQSGRKKGLIPRRLPAILPPGQQIRTRRSPLKKKKKKKKNTHKSALPQHQTLEKDRFGVVEELFEKSREINLTGNNKPYFYTTDNRTFFKSKTLLQEYFSKRIHTLPSEEYAFQSNVTESKVEKKKDEFQELKLFSKAKGCRTPPASNENFLEIDGGNVKRLHNSINLLDHYSRSNLSRYAVVRLDLDVVDTPERNRDKENLRKREEKEKAMYEENLRKQKEQEEALKNAGPVEWDCPSCGYINIITDSKCSVCDVVQPQAEVVKKPVDENKTAKVDIRRNMISIPVSLLVHSIKYVEMMMKYTFNRMNEFVNLNGDGSFDVALSVLCFFHFGMVASLEENDEVAYDMNQTWADEIKLSLASKKRDYEQQMLRTEDRDGFEDKYSREEEVDQAEMQMTIEEIRKLEKQRQKKKTLKKKSKGTNQKFKAIGATFLDYDPTSSDIICLNLTSFARQKDLCFDANDDDSISMTDYIAGMEIRLSYCKSTCHLLIFLHQKQMDEMKSMELQTWKFIEMIKEDTHEIVCFIFRRSDDENAIDLEEEILDLV